MSFLRAAGVLLAAQSVRRFRLEWGWQAGGRLHFAKVIWHGRDADDAVRRFTLTTPKAINVRVLEEVRP